MTDGRYDALSVRLQKNVLTLEQIDKKAKELGLNRSQFVTQALLMLVNFDPVFWDRISMYSQGGDMPPWLVIQNMLIKRFAEEAAEYEVWGETNQLLPEFGKVETQGGPKTITGEALFNQLKRMFIHEKEKEKIKELLQREANGYLLLDHEKEFLKKHRVGRAWLESEEYKEEIGKEQKANDFLNQLIRQGVIDSSIKGKIHPFTVCSFMEQMEQKKLTREALINMLKFIDEHE